MSDKHTTKHAVVPKSYVVQKNSIQGLFILRSHWAPGYTKAYCETPEEAVDVAIAEAEREMNEAQARVMELYDFKAHLFAEDN